MGDIAEGVLYRSSSPVNPELGRNSYADKLACERILGLITPPEVKAERRKR